jgi:RNA polymerase sigma-70 factor (ECF subfamily)
MASPERGPDAVVEAREATSLAFVAAVQLLPPKQRAVLVLRDVLGWSAREAADTLGDSVAAVNSALQRARERLDRERSEQTLARLHRPATTRVEAELVRRFQEAWDSVDIDGLVALLTDDTLLTMPPEGARIEGAAAVGRFFATQPVDGQLDRIRLLPARANGQPALAAYADERANGCFDAYGVMVLAFDGSLIAGITGFPRRPELFERLGLPTRL